MIITILVIVAIMLGASNIILFALVPGFIIDLVLIGCFYEIINPTKETKYK